MSLFHDFQGNSLRENSIIMKILVLNSGSSSIKFQVFDFPKGNVLAKGLIERIGEKIGKVNYQNLLTPTDIKLEKTIKSHEEGLREVSELLFNSANGIISDKKEISAIGHRVVHGGDYFKNSVLIDQEVKSTIEKLFQLAPLHNPPNLQGIMEAEKQFPGCPQVAVFDTAFHQSIPEFAYRYAIPNELFERHKIRVYGFHGTSHQYVAQQAAKNLMKPLSEVNLITIHLGNGCSITAIKEGKAVDTSLGFTPLPGLMMGTRTGDIDPSVVFYLLKEENLDPEKLEKIFNKESGLKGIAGSNDMREVFEKKKEGDKEAILAIDMFCYRIKKYVGAYLAVLGKVDAIVFTGGIGENSSDIRKLVLQNLDSLGVKLDENANSNKEIAIHSEDSSVSILIIPTNEELEIAKQTYSLLMGS